MKSINLIPDGSNGYTSTKVFNLNGHRFRICQSEGDSFPYICTSVDDADENLEPNEIFECVSRLFSIDAESQIGRIIMENGSAIDVADQAKKDGVDDLRQSAIKKVIAGLTSLEEINRVTKD